MKKILSIFLIMFSFVDITAFAEDALINVNGSSVQTLEILFMLTIITLLPSIFIMMTSFTRIIIVLSFLKNALGIQQAPPSQVLVGIALFLSLFIMNPVVSEINENAYTPYKNDQITMDQALSAASKPLKEFMLKQTDEETTRMFLSFANKPMPENSIDLEMTIIIPSFMTSELQRAFIIGFLLFIPFLLIDIIVSSTLMSMGMIMLPPAMIAMPFKILLFIIIDGWQLLFTTLIKGFNF